jgi:energy-coupling factor transport system permease protein
MSQFEFMRSLPIGQYLPLDSPLHHRDPRAKLIAAVLLVLALTFSRRIEGLALGVGLVVLALGWAHVSLRFALRSLVAPLPFLLILAALQVLLNVGPPGELALLTLGPLQVTASDLLAGLTLLVRFAGLILAIGLTTFTLSTSEMTRALNQLLGPLARIGLPAQDLVMVVQVTLRFLPMLAQSAERIAKAQASRGADWDSHKGNLLARVRQVTPVIIPLFLASLRKAEQMALAMDARAYGSTPQRTSLASSHFYGVDGWLVAGAVAAGAGILLL